MYVISCVIQSILYFTKVSVLSCLVTFHTHALTAGVMRISDFPLLFNDQQFPILWEREYIRLLTTFEVAVELGNGELLIPSHLNARRPNLPQTMFPEDLV